MQVTNSANHSNLNYDNFNTLPCVVQVYNFTISYISISYLLNSLISLNEGW